MTNTELEDKIRGAVEQVVLIGSHDPETAYKAIAFIPTVVHQAKLKKVNRDALLFACLTIAVSVMNEKAEQDKPQVVLQ